MTHSSDDRFHNTVDIVEHAIVPETPDQMAVRFQIGGPSLVRSAAVRMLPTIKLNNQTSGLTTESDDISFDWHLPPKLKPVQAPIAQPEPQDEFSIRLITSEFSSGTD